VQEQGARYNLGDMTRIAITQAAFDAIVGTMPFGEARFALGNAGYEPRRDPQALPLIWIERGWVEKLWAMRRAGEDWSGVIVRIPAVEAGGRA
jgi:hypothetical protein